VRAHVMIHEECSIGMRARAAVRTRLSCGGRWRP
jgi:hypothetical protein